MTEDSVRTLRDHLGLVDFDAVVAWLLGFAVVAWLGLNGGGFDALEHQRFGVCIWLLILAGLCLSLIPTRRLGGVAWLSIGLFGLFAIWTGFSLIWTGSPDKTGSELARVATYLGIFVLAIFSGSGRAGRFLTSGVAAAIVLIATIALLSKLHPAWFPEAGVTGEMLPKEARRLAYPIGYWNGLGALVAIGLPLLLNLAASARTTLVRTASAACLPVLILTLYFTLSRGGFLAAAIAICVYFVLVPSRFPKFLTLLLGLGGGGVLITASHGNHELSEGLLVPAARDQGNEILLLTIIVVFAVAAAQALVIYTGRKHRAPTWLKFNRRRTLAFVGVALTTVLVLAAVSGAPSKVGESWTDFKSAEGLRDSADRLESASGNGRYQYWSAAVREFESEPFVGTGAGTFEYWWATTGDRPGFVRDAHSLYFQTLGELGILGAAVLVLFILVIVASGLRMLAKIDVARRMPLAAAMAGVSAFIVVGAFDWIWQIPVLPAVFLLLGAILVPVGARQTHGPVQGGWRATLGLGFAATAAIVAIAIPLTSAAFIDKSQNEVRVGNLNQALRYARNAGDVFPAAAAPNLQQALILERLGNLRAAEVEAKKAIKDEPVNWRNWLVLSRIQASLGQVHDSVASYREASRLNHLSPIFD